MHSDEPLSDAQREVQESARAWVARRSVVTIGAATFRMTCFACPEQYDVDLGEAGNRGYVRLRHGGLRADYLPDGDFDRRVQVFEHYFDDDAPCFESDEERNEYLTQIAAQLHVQHRAHNAAESDGARPPAAPARGEGEPSR